MSTRVRTVYIQQGDSVCDSDQRAYSPAHVCDSSQAIRTRNAVWEDGGALWVPIVDPV